MHPGVVLGQNCVQLSDTSLDDFFVQKFFLSRQCKYAMNIGVAQIRGAFL